MIALALMATSCMTWLDPYDGGYGARANVNGKKCVMRAVSTSNVGFSDSQKPYYAFSYNARMGYWINKQEITLKIKLYEDTPLQNGVKYLVGSDPNTATLEAEDQASVPLTGWVKFNSINGSEEYIEAEFEFDSQEPGLYTIRHGLLRINQHS